MRPVPRLVSSMVLLCAASSPGLAAPPMTEVAVVGMIHDGHLGSERWGLGAVRETLRRLDPDVVCAEIPPDRWDAVWETYRREGVVRDDRVVRFPEYTEVLLPLAVELGFTVVPCAAWTAEMAAERRARIETFRTAPEHAEANAEYERRQAALQGRYPEPIDGQDDPYRIHSEAYDRRMAEELRPYDELMNDVIGAGGWSAINEAHFALVDGAVRAHRGRRLVITFGAGHKYWFLDQLRQRSDVRLLDVRPYLPPREVTMDGADAARVEVEQLHAFFQRWFLAELPDDDASFARFADALADEFRMVTPDGRELDRAAVLAGVRAGHGRRRPPYRIWIEHPRVRNLAEDLELVVYEEWQQLDDGPRGRTSTALLRRGDDGTLQWLHVHETWIEGTGGD